MSELFPVEQVSLDSPKLKWMKQHQISTQYDSNVRPGDEDEFSGETIYPWCAFTGPFVFPRPDAGYGNTEDEAISNWAKANGVKLWNEEQLKP